MKAIILLLVTVIFLSQCNQTNATTEEKECDLEEVLHEAEIVESRNWGDKEYWEVDSSSERGIAMENWDGAGAIEHVGNSEESYLHIKNNPYLVCAYEVDDNNEYYYTEEGILFSKDKTVLYRYPALKTGWYYQIPSTVKVIDSDAFLGVYYLRELVIPDSVTQIVNGVVFHEACLERIHFPASIISEFDIDNLAYLPYVKEIILPTESPIADAIRDATESGYMDLGCALSYY